MKTYKTTAIALFALLTIVSTGNVMANESKKSANGIELRYVGNNENQPVFQLNVNNADEDEFLVTFRDEQNNVLYSGKLKGVNISKNFQLDTDTIGDNVMSVEVKSRKSNKSEVYKINRTHSFTEDISVSKL
jgi:hypothetical protein